MDLSDLLSGLGSIRDALGGPWLDRAQKQTDEDIAAYQRGGVPALLQNTQNTQDLAGGFGGNTKAVTRLMPAVEVGGKTFTGMNHGEAFGQLTKELGPNNPAAKYFQGVTEGFVTPEGQFLTRHEASRHIGADVNELSSGHPEVGKLPATMRSEELPAPGYIPQTVDNPVGKPYPGIYKNPRILAEEANARVAPEDPAMKQLFGVTRDDLFEMNKGRVGNIEPSIKTVKNPKGSYTSEAIMNDRNAGRLIDALAELEKFPALTHGMDPWYIMDPLYARLEQLTGKEAPGRYTNYNTITSMASPASDVLTEINRGTAAHMMAVQGRFPEFVKYGGMAAEKRGADFPPELAGVIGHPYHSTSQAGPMARYLETGKVEMSQPKVPLYIQSSGVPETGFQTKLPVPDAHFTRAVGMADVRKNANPGVSMKTPEYAQTGPWFRDQVATPMGLEAVPAQARTWGLFSPQTGVDTAIGAPKLELLSIRIAQRARELGIDPATLRDAVLMGKNHAGWAGLGIGLGGAALAPPPADAPYFAP